MAKGVWAELEQDSWDRAAGTREPGQTGGIGQLGQDSRDKTAGTEKSGQEYWDRKVRKTDGIVQPG